MKARWCLGGEISGFKRVRTGSGPTLMPCGRVHRTGNKGGPNSVSQCPYLVGLGSLSELEGPARITSRASCSRAGVGSALPRGLGKEAGHEGFELSGAAPRTGGLLFLPLPHGHCHREFLLALRAEKLIGRHGDPSFHTPSGRRASSVRQPSRRYLIIWSPSPAVSRGLRLQGVSTRWIRGRPFPQL